MAIVAMMCSCGSSDASKGGVVELTDVAQLKESGKPMVLDFTATWCGPCQRLKPHFKALSEKMADKVTFITVDVDKWQELAQEYGAQAVPTIVVVNADGKKTTTTGYMEEAELEKFISDNI